MKTKKEKTMKKMKTDKPAPKMGSVKIEPKLWRKLGRLAKKYACESTQAYVRMVLADEVEKEGRFL